MNIRTASLLSAAYLVALAGCQSTPAPSAEKTANVNGFALQYVEQGQGETVVLVHGAVSDLRTWDRQRAALAAKYRAIAYTQRYFGTAPWGQNWPPFGATTHAEDLAAFVRALNVGPVHLVAWSYSGQVVLDVALRRPELVRSAFVFEAGDPTYVTDASELKQLSDDGAAFGAGVQAVQAGNNAEAVRQLIDTVGERKGYFDAQPAALRAIQLDSARTMPLLFSNKPTPQITCGQLAQIKPRVAIVRGGDSRPTFAVTADRAARCMPSATRIVIPKANHMWPGDEPKAFADAVDTFIAARR